ncbi:hypothetical protein [Pectobacterium polaris]|uniref:hypothetical protein n=1 Tax=Pectobacterium polaris TaxID=2042057 RepID=UPI001F0858ED|nr:hypothetical protein [Pectobacterium polaris]
MLHKLPSFDRQHTAMLIYAGEIRFGPPYFSLSIDGKALDDRVFGKDMLWSPDSRYLAVQEWLSTAERDGPQTALLCIDVLEERQCQLSQIARDFKSLAVRAVRVQVPSWGETKVNCSLAGCAVSNIDNCSTLPAFLRVSVA